MRINLVKNFTLVNFKMEDSKNIAIQISCLFALTQE
jgi:hypothetical protein